MTKHPNLQQEVLETLSHSLADTHDLSVTTLNGYVTLEGTVHDEGERLAAAMLIGALPGVRRVTNHLHYSPDDLSRRALAALAAHGFGTRALSVTADHNRLTLNGQVASWREAEAIEGVLRGLEGVQGVVNHLGVF